MKTIARLALAAAACAAAAAPAVITPSPASAAKYKECEFTKKKAKREKAPVCARDLGKSRWIVVSGEWHERLTVHDEDGDAVFDGTGSADFLAGGLNGNSPFPNRRNPVRSLVSTRPEGVEFSASSQGGWTDGQRFFDCSFTAPEGSAPNGFGGIFQLKGKSVAVQWILGAAGFGCSEGPYPTPSPDFPDPVASYKLSSFKSRRLVRLPIKFDFTDAHDKFNARVTYDGIARLRRYR